LFDGFNWLIIPAALLSIIFHEISHGYVAYLLGDRTAKERGRLTLNPLAHIDYIGSACLLLFGFGWAKAVRVNASNFRNPKRDMAITAMAGPAVNVLVAFLSLLLLLFMFVITWLTGGFSEDEQANARGGSLW
jgi:Zn-dependent protease